MSVLVIKLTLSLLQVDELRHVLETIKINISEIDARHSEVLKATSKAVTSRTADDLQKLIDVVRHAT